MIIVAKITALIISMYEGDPDVSPETPSSDPSQLDGILTCQFCRVHFYKNGWGVILSMQPGVARVQVPATPVVLRLPEGCRDDYKVSRGDSVTEYNLQVWLQGGIDLLYANDGYISPLYIYRH